MQFVKLGSLEVYMLWTAGVGNWKAQMVSVGGSTGISIHFMNVEAFLKVRVSLVELESSSIHGIMVKNKLTENSF